MRDADLVRLLVLAGTVLLFGVAFTIWVLYIKTWLRHPKLVSNRLIALHVWLVASSYMCFMVGAGLELWQRVGQPFTYRLPLFAVGFVLGIVGLYVTAKSQARRAR